METFGAFLQNGFSMPKSPSFFALVPKVWPSKEYRFSPTHLPAPRYWKQTQWPACDVNSPIWGMDGLSPTNLAIPSGDNWVLKHLPMILHAEQREFDADSPQLRLSQHFGKDYKVWVLHLVVQEGLHLITELTTTAELGKVFHGIFKCSRWLYEKASIMHRDISRNNLMYHVIDGKIYNH
ncbi:hypothetical protein DFH07DRAFT_783571 [Mycena maculata]|uniref:Fungal-type protein kinase domain-containing protein n=1 Tax=Mycena maculata TaxID=230809 RepID=A0AAD7MLT9_9AGAR|nr:hypothetical protein DFH07DRAFT_783571 [Mycena maculata]